MEDVSITMDDLKLKFSETLNALRAESDTVAAQQLQIQKLERLMLDRESDSNTRYRKYEAM